MTPPSLPIAPPVVSPSIGPRNGMSTHTTMAYKETTIGLLLLLSSLSSACSLSPPSPDPSAPIHSCLAQVHQLLPDAHPRITSTSRPSTHHHITYPTYDIHLTYQSRASGPFNATCHVITQRPPQSPTTTLEHPVPWFVVGYPTVNTQCLSDLDAPSPTLMYLAYKREQSQIADRRALYHLYKCPEEKSMSATGGEN